jgi:hypothetical protein
VVNSRLRIIGLSLIPWPGERKREERAFKRARRAIEKLEEIRKSRGD